MMNNLIFKFAHEAFRDGSKASLKENAWKHKYNLNITNENISS